jgi:predicted nucleic acid-binding protein
MEVQTFDWIQMRQVNNRTVVEVLQNDLDTGEAEAIALALELKADQLLIDERRGRTIAANLNLRFTGIIGILVEAKSRKLIPTVQPLLDSLINQAGFWIAESLYKNVLQLVGEDDAI